MHAAYRKIMAIPEPLLVTSRTNGKQTKVNVKNIKNSHKKSARFAINRFTRWMLSR